MSRSSNQTESFYNKKIIRFITAQLKISLNIKNDFKKSRELVYLFHSFKN